MNWETFKIKDGKVFKIPYETVKNLTVKELIDGPYILKFVLPNKEQMGFDEVPIHAYFVGNDEAHERAKDKTPKYLSEFFDKIQRFVGVPVLMKTVEEVRALRATKEVFPDSKIVNK